MADLDAAFADFMAEVGDGPAEKSADEGSSARKPKRARKADAPRFEQGEALRKAAYQGKCSEVEVILASLTVGERLLLIDDLDPEDGFAALHLATIQGHVPVMKALLTRRADVDVLTREGDTPLMWSAHQGNITACRALLDFGADVFAKKMLKTASMQAKAAGHRRVTEMLDSFAFDVAAGLNRTAMSKEKAAAARRAANASMLAETIRQHEEKEEDEAFWASVRARREGREAAGEDADIAARKAYMNAKAQAAKEEAARAEQDAALMSLPARMQPHYRLLDLPPDAADQEVRKAYKRYALKHHPDKNPEDPAKAKELFTQGAVAYEAICEYLISTEGKKSTGVRVAPPKNY